MVHVFMCATHTVYRHHRFDEEWMGIAVSLVPYGTTKNVQVVYDGFVAYSSRNLQRSDIYGRKHHVA